jgi:hypothetical protein
MTEMKIGLKGRCEATKARPPKKWENKGWSPHGHLELGISPCLCYHKESYNKKNEEIEN